MGEGERGGEGEVDGEDEEGAGGVGGVGGEEGDSGADVPQGGVIGQEVDARGKGGGRKGGEEGVGGGKGEQDGGAVGEEEVEAVEIQRDATPEEGGLVLTHAGALTADQQDTDERRGRG